MQALISTNILQRLQTKAIPQYVYLRKVNQPCRGLFMETSASLLERLRTSPDEAAWRRPADLYRPLALGCSLEDSPRRPSRQVACSEQVTSGGQGADRLIGDFSEMFA